MKIVHSIAQMQNLSREFRKAGKTIAVVPTMGCLHEGHMSLVDVAKSSSDITVVTIFVNPTQFGPSEDFEKYPRDFESDRKLCELRKVDLIFAPSPDEMYPDKASTWVVEEKLSQGLCGRSRPGHFRGVTTVVAKLFNAVLPDVAVFGEKDYQQAKIIQRMTRDLNFPVRIITAPIIREAGGLAMSSRNKYLSADERRSAISISTSLKNARNAIASVSGNITPSEIHKIISKGISDAGGKVDYVEILDAETLEAKISFDGKIVIAVAAFFGSTRLIDNIQVDCQIT